MKENSTFKGKNKYMWGIFITVTIVTTYNE